MQNELKKEIKRLCKRQLERNREAKETDEKYKRKFQKRTGLRPRISAKAAAPLLKRHFDPIHCKRHANGIASGIWNSVLRNDYEVIPAIQHFIPKPDGSTREIMAFAIPDAALANVLMRRTRRRNLKRLSPHSFAYHPDKNVFDAILSLKDFDDEGKLFAVQIDFRKYFDNIPIGYLRNKLDDRETFSITPHERHIFEALLNHKFAPRTRYMAGTFKRRFRGTPQGSSASLVLANLANHDLDRMLAFQSGKFVRFADDVVALSNNYEGAIQLEKCFDSHCKTSGLEINRQKSPGISIVSSRSSEIRTTEYFTYLGYGFTESGLILPQKSVDKLKQKVSRLLNIYLINALQYGYNEKRASASGRFDWDLLGFVYELRRSLYGGLSEKTVSGFLTGTEDLNKMRGLMGFYALLDDNSRLKELDGWIANITVRACRKRDAILQANYNADCPRPSETQLITGSWLNLGAWTTTEDPEDELETRFPSLVRGWRASRKYFFTRGLERVQAPSYQSSGDIASLFDFY